MVFTISIRIQAQESSKIQVALILDTSNSMDGLIDQAKAQLWKVVNEMALARKDGKMPNLEIALYEYGNDGLTPDEGFIRMVSQLTTDLDKISEDLFALKTNGGDEYCGYVIKKASQQLKWSPSNNDLKLIFIAGNEPFTQGEVNYEESCKKAIAKSIVINTIFCGNYQEGVEGKWKHGADLADGKYMNIDQNEKSVYIESPYDDEIMKLNESLNRTYVPYGESGEEYQSRQTIQDANAMSYSKVNVVNRAVTKSSANYKNTSWDLVDFSKEKDFDMSEIEEDELPEEMQKMSEEERINFLKEKNKEREKLQLKIKELNQKRKKYVAKEKKKNAEANTLDAAMIKAVREQAAVKKFKFIDQ